MEKAYCDIYEEHLDILEKVQGNSRASNGLAHLQQRLHDQAR